MPAASTAARAGGALRGTRRRQGEGNRGERERVYLRERWARGHGGLAGGEAPGRGRGGRRGGAGRAGARPGGRGRRRWPAACPLVKVGLLWVAQREGERLERERV